MIRDVGLDRASRQDFDHPDRDISLVPEALVKAGLKVTLFREAQADLEEAFLTLTKGKVT